MNPVKSIIGGLCLFSFQLKSQSASGFYLEPGISLGLQQSSFTGGVSGALGFKFSKRHSINFGARELYNVQRSNVVSAIHVTYRYHFSKGFYLGGGFAHQHEITSLHYLSEPVSASMGTSKNIFHRSGMIFESGFVFDPVGQNGFFSHLIPTAGLSAAYMPDNGPNPLLSANAGLRYEF